MQRQLCWLDGWLANFKCLLCTLLGPLCGPPLRLRSRRTTRTRARFNAEHVGLGGRALADVHGRRLKNLLCSVDSPAPVAARTEQGDDRREAESILPPRTSAAPANGAARSPNRCPAAAPELHEGSYSVQQPWCFTLRRRLWLRKGVPSWLSLGSGACAPRE